MNRTTNQAFYGKLILDFVKAHVCSLVYRMAKGRLMTVHCTCTEKGSRLLGFHGLERLMRCEVTYLFLVQAVKSWFYRRHALL